MGNKGNKEACLLYLLDLARRHRGIVCNIDLMVVICGVDIAETGPL